MFSNIFPTKIRLGCVSLVFVKSFYTCSREGIFVHYNYCYIFSNIIAYSQSKSIYVCTCERVLMYHDSQNRLGCVSLIFVSLFTCVHSSAYSCIITYSEILLHILKTSLFILVHASVYSCIVIHCQYICIYSQNIHISVYPYIFSEVPNIFVYYYTFSVCSYMFSEYSHFSISVYIIKRSQYIRIYILSIFACILKSTFSVIYSQKSVLSSIYTIK